MDGTVRLAEPDGVSHAGVGNKEERLSDVKSEVVDGGVITAPDPPLRPS